jgi:ribulose-5-phosphate 4-epimerase/fuculose-1-phosphate aldolase
VEEPTSAEASAPAPAPVPVEEPAPVEEEPASEPTKEQDDPSVVAALAEKEAELERLHMENARLRQSLVGSTEVIEQLEEPPMPPLVDENIVIPSHIVSDFVRIGRQLDREHLVRATMGSVAMLHPEQPGVMISSRNMVTLPRMNERSLCAGTLGTPSPRGAPADWHVMEVVLASVSMVTGGPAAVIHMHGPHTTAASCEQDLVLLTPIDAMGKQHIGKIIIVDPDPDHPEEFLRQVAEALQQGGMRCVVVRGNGAYSVGADFDQAWANAAMLEHSMHIHLLSRQANLKI